MMALKIHTLYFHVVMIGMIIVLVDRFFYIYLNLNPIGFYVDTDTVRKPHVIYDIIAAAMGFINFNDYVASTPGYGVYTELTYWEDNSHRDFLVEPSSENLGKSSSWVRLEHSDEYPYNRRHTYWLSDIHSYGGFPFILPNVDEMISLERFSNIKRNDSVLICCRDWNEDNEWYRVYLI